MTGPRPDITDSLVHYARGTNLDEAFQVLRTILREQRLRQQIGAYARIASLTDRQSNFTTMRRTNTRLKLPAHLDYGMNSSSARRSLSAIR